jgi:ABC-type antimicrobial peptide transport system permease subunit
MLKNYFKTAVRNLMQHKTYTGINIIGLTIAFVCSILLFLNAKFELSFDDFYKDKNLIFKMYRATNSATNGKETGASMSYPVAPALKLEVPEIKAASRYFWGSSSIEYKAKKINIQTSLVDNDFFEIFSLSVIKGNKSNPLADIGSVVISENAAKIIFNEEDPIGKLIKVKIDVEWKELMVGSVVSNAPKNSSVPYEVLINSQLAPGYTKNKNNWNNSHHDVYVKLKESSSPTSVEDKCRLMLHKYNATDSAYMKDAGYIRDEKGDYQALRLLPLSQFHFDRSVGSGKVISKTYVYTILLISFFILLIACFNFINLNIARSFTRAKEVGVRKSLGADKKQIVVQVWGESLLACTISLIIGIVVSIVLFPSFNKVFGAQLRLDFFYQPITILAFVFGVILVSLLAGGYPALIVSKLNTVSVLKGSVSLKKPGIFRNSLIIFQFTMACFLMACTLIAYKQFEFMRAMPLGFNKESVISLPLSNTQEGRVTLTRFRNRLASNPAIVSISGANMNIGLGKDGSRSKATTGFVHKGKGISTNWMTVDYDFLKTLDIKLLNGRDFSKEYGTDSINGVLVTESAARQFGEKELVGLSFSTDTAKPNYSIVGVISDFHLYSPHNDIEPLTIDISNNEPIRYIFFKTNSSKPLQTMALVETLYKEFEPGKDFKASFLDENTDNWYNDEKKLSMLLAICSVIAIVLSCLGLFALALLMIQQRIKEIGVRKVLGASVFNINTLLVKDFLKLVLIAILIASPLAWWTMGKWLQELPYHITLNAWLFLCIGCIAILISLLTVSFHTIKAAMSNPVKSLRTE